MFKKDFLEKFSSQPLPSVWSPKNKFEWLSCKHRDANMTKTVPVVHPAHQLWDEDDMWPDKDSRNNVHSISGARYPWNLQNAKEILSTLICRQHNFAHDWSRWTIAGHLLVFEFDHTESNRSTLSPAEPHLDIRLLSDPKSILHDGSMSI